MLIPDNFFRPIAVLLKGFARWRSFSPLHRSNAGPVGFSNRLSLVSFPGVAETFPPPSSPENPRKSSFCFWSIGNDEKTLISLISIGARFAAGFGNRACGRVLGCRTQSTWLTNETKMAFKWDSRISGLNLNRPGNQSAETVWNHRAGFRNQCWPPPGCRTRSNHWPKSLVAAMNQSDQPAPPPTLVN